MGEIISIFCHSLGFKVAIVSSFSLIMIMAPPLAFLRSSHLRLAPTSSIFAHVFFHFPTEFSISTSLTRLSTPCLLWFTLLPFFLALDNGSSSHISWVRFLETYSYFVYLRLWCSSPFPLSFFHFYLIRSFEQCVSSLSSLFWRLLLLFSPLFDALAKNLLKKKLWSSWKDNNGPLISVICQAIDMNI